jgi:hypothetical protein
VLLIIGLFAGLGNRAKGQLKISCGRDGYGAYTSLTSRKPLAGHLRALFGTCFTRLINHKKTRQKGGFAEIPADLGPGALIFAKCVSCGGSP